MADPVAVLLSIHPAYALAIATGTKRVELRRKFPQLRSGTPVFLYSTLPVGAITGMARIERVDRRPPSDLWADYGSECGLSAVAFDAYFSGCDAGSALVLGEYLGLRPLKLNEWALELPTIRPPQSFRFITTSAMERLIERRMFT